MPTTTDASGSPRRPTSAATRRATVDRYRRSGLTQRAFCEQTGVPLSTLQWWLVQARREAGPATPVPFVEVTPPCASTPAWAVEIVTRPGVTLRLREPLPLAVLRRLVRGR